METKIESLGPARFRSPLHHIGSSNVHFRTDAHRVLMDDTCSDADGILVPPARSASRSPDRASRSSSIPPRTTAGIVTCGGLCPGLNDVIRGLVMELTHRYGVTKIYGFRYGFEGLVPRYGQTPMVLKPDSMDAIHAFGGSILGTSRGPQDIGGDGQLPRGNGRGYPLRGRRRRQPARRQRDQPRDPPARPAQERHRHPQDHRQRHHVPRQELRLRDRVRRGRQGRDLRPRRVARLPQRRRPRQAHGPRLRLHRLLCRPGRQRGQFRPDPGGPVRSRWPPRLPRGALLPRRPAQTRRHRRCRGRGPAPHGRAPATPWMPPATAASATSAFS